MARARVSAALPTADRLREALGARGVNAKCPAHDDEHGSLSIGESADGKPLLKCHAGCSQSAVIEALRARGIWPEPERKGLTVTELAAAKGLPEALLRESGFADDEIHGRPVVRMEYRDAAGNVACVRYRGALVANDTDLRFWFRKGDRQQLFGLWRLKAGPVVLVEGETDTLALWTAGFNAIGVPGADAWRDDRFAQALEHCATIYVHIEPDAGGQKFRAAFERSRLRDRVKFFSVAPAAKDPCELRAKDPGGFDERVKVLLREATTAPGSAEDAAPPERSSRRPPISWDSLEGREPPPPQSAAVSRRSAAAAQAARAGRSAACRAAQRQRSPGENVLSLLRFRPIRGAMRIPASFML